MTHLTDRNIRSFHPQPGRQVTISDKGTSGVRGLSVLVSYGGSKIFYFRYLSPSKKQKRIRIGQFPQTSLAVARGKAREFHRLLDNGDDPFSVVAKSKLSKREFHTIGELWVSYHTQALKRKKSAKFENQLWQKHVASKLDPLDLRDFTRDTVLDFIIPFRQNFSPALSSRVQALISQLGTYAVEQRALEFSPVYQLGKKKPSPTSNRFLTRSELKVFWNALGDPDALKYAKVSEPLAITLKLALLTCARRAEIASAAWDDIDFKGKIWKIPATQTKNGRDHVVPLSDVAIELFSGAKLLSRRPNSKFIFPGRRTDVKTVGPGHIRPDAITRACSRIYKTLLAKDGGVGKFSPHDLRRTGATYLASTLKTNRFVISQILNHSSDNGGGAAVTSIYARYDYLEEKRDALMKLSEFITQVSKE